MRITTIVLASTLLATAACNGTVSEGTGGSGATGSAPASSGAGDTTGTATGSSSSGGGGDTVTLTMDAFTVDPGAEVYKCQNFANPFGGADAEVTTFESHMAKGSHHLLLFYKPGATDSALEDCSGLEFAATPYSTQLPDDALEFPAGVAALVPKTTGLRLQSHYLNVTSTPITAHVEVTFHLAASGTVTQQAGVLFVVSDMNFSIPPGATQVVTKNCPIPQDMNLIKAGSHMHKHGLDFLATAAGNELLHTTTWDDPAPTKFNPPRVLHKGDPLDFACKFFNNDPVNSLTFGESASTNEMCIFVGSFYPAPAGQATLSCF
jgi:hypothetical protein